MKLTIRLVILAALASASSVSAADWPQFMRNAAHTGDAADETLRLPLGLLAQVKLDEAVLTSPAVVAGRVYVVDQMGTAYCVDGSGRIVWKTAPDGAEAMGANTSSPCVIEGRVYFGTTAGTFHILDAKNGRQIKMLKIDSPIVSAATAANGSIYFQAMDSVLRCHDLDGKERWRWDHYTRYKEPPELTKSKEQARGHPGGYDRPYHGGGDVAIVNDGQRIVTSFGWDLVCIEDAQTEGKLLWCNRAPSGRDGAAPMSSSISGDWIYNAGMGADGYRSLRRLSLSTGDLEKDPSRRSSYPWNTAAVRGSIATYGDSNDGRTGIVLFDFAAKKTVLAWRDDKEATPFASSHALTKSHLVATTLRGEVVVIDLNAKLAVKPFRFATPHGKGIASAPAVADGCIYFGCDDGYLYVLGPNGDRKPTIDARNLHEPRGKRTLATGKAYDWPSTYGNPGNTSAVDDPGLKPPLRLRWAARGYGHFLTPALGAGSDLITISLNGVITCQEQMTGRIRWRTQLPGPEWSTSSGMLVQDGRLYIPRPTFGRQDGAFYCLDQKTGKQLWSAEGGGRYIWERAAPVSAAGVVAFGFATKGKPPGTMIQAWDAATGKPAWQVELNVAGNRSGSIGGCTDGKVMYFTAGAGTWQWKQEGDKKRGEFVAIDARSGKVLRRSHEQFGTSYPVLSGDHLFLNGDGGLHCTSATDGSLLWKRTTPGYTRFSVGSDFLVMRGYGGHGAKIRLDDGKDYPNCQELGGPTHACSSVALTPNHAFAITVGGLNVRDVKTGELRWLSPGFAPRGCVNPTLANGRVFWPSAASGMIFCWEPKNQ